MGALLVLKAAAATMLIAMTASRSTLRTSRHSE